MNKALKFTFYYSLAFLFLFAVLLAFMYIKFDIQDLGAFISHYKSKILLALAAPSLSIAMSAISKKPKKGCLN